MIRLERFGDGGVADRNFQKLSEAVNPLVPQARAFNSAAISITNNTVTAITFDSEHWDSGSLHSTTVNTGRLTAPITGLYDIGVSIQWAANATGTRYVDIKLNGTTLLAACAHPTVATAGVATYQTVVTSYQLAAGDWVQPNVYQDSGGALNVVVGASNSPEFWMQRVAGYVNQGV